MAGISKQHLDSVLNEYCTLRPNRATFTGDEFVMKVQPPGVARNIAVTLVVAIFGTIGIGSLILSAVAVATPDRENRWTIVLIGVVGFLLMVAFVFVVVNGQTMRRVIDLQTGVVTATSMVRSRQLVDLTSVSSFHKLTRTTYGAPVTMSIVLHVVRPGNKRTKKVTFLPFKTSKSFDQFVPVMDALISYFYKPVAGPDQSSR